MWATDLCSLTIFGRSFAHLNSPSLRKQIESFAICIVCVVFLIKTKVRLIRLFLTPYKTSSPTITNQFKRRIHLKIAVKVKKVWNIFENWLFSIIWRSFDFLTAFYSLIMSSEENMDVSNVENIAVTPTEAEAPAEVSLNPDWFVREDSKLTKNIAQITFSKTHKKLRNKKKRNWRLNFHRPWAVSEDQAVIQLFSKSDCRKGRNTLTRVIIKWQNRRLAEAWRNRSSQTKFRQARQSQHRSPFLSEKRRSFKTATSSLLQVNSSRNATPINDT